jgi:uncharacterized integral membrane protein (TIGR00698 family)
MIDVAILRKNGITQVLNGVWLVVLTAFASLYIADIPQIKSYGLSSLLMGMIIGLFYGNTLSGKLPKSWAQGVRYCTRDVLRLAIILLGFNFTFQDIANQGVTGLIANTIIVVGTLVMGYFIGTKFLKMDKEMALICSVGPAICGASAVLAAESVLRTAHAKTAVAVSTVVLFGTVSIFLYPFIYNFLPHGLTDSAFGIYIGATIHEVPQVVAAGNFINPDVAQTSIIVKMARVLMLVPVLFILGFIWKRIRPPSEYDDRRKKTSIVPWWALIFVALVGFNSVYSIPDDLRIHIQKFDVFLFTMAMAAIGMETTYAKFREVGGKPFVLAFILFIWLTVGGWALSYLLM